MDRSVHKRGRATSPQIPPEEHRLAGSAGAPLPEARPIDIVSLHKRFGSVSVLRGIDLQLRAGEVVGLMGPNGAGKSTLLKTLSGLYSPDGGQILLGGEPVRSLGDRPEVAFIHQDLGLIDEMSITDNLRLAQRPSYRVWPLLDHQSEDRLARRALQFVGLALRPSTKVGELSPAEKTLVAIARAFARGASTLFVDEATSTLATSSARRVIEVLRSLARAGAIVVLITHKLSEILEAADRVVVLLDGQIVTDDPAAGLDREALVAKMRSVDSRHAPRDDGAGDGPGAELVRFEQVRSQRCGPVTLTVRAGEAVGLTGTPGSGLHDIGLMAAGLVAPVAGKVHRAPGVRCGLVPPHRETQGGFNDLQVRENMSISALPQWRNRIGLLDGRRESRHVAGIAARLSVTPRSPSAPFWVLSGGNKQKAIFGRLLLQQPDVFVLCEPTRGVDVATRAEIYSLITQLRRDGRGVLVLSSDAEDLLAVCDRIATVGSGPVEEPEPVGALSTGQLEGIL
ncbi:sugar ABC transporter ATP-binding protein [Acidiferrimicrobium sp. IK]|uniref:ATP-binding cassette domain-containing protein n=1 Tax=Acidiferrimicrobium sp. IK TaxID=2871700 RepID=UPI0021CB4E08|nr:sugar ABC transporter ATP-binding protein [Acidiferrimicrobium sp. IK]MCU4186426.1 sugar ABC transporter ATP-binding protein [Acidiferrimicrobium sp. IK]